MTDPTERLSRHRPLSDRFRELGQVGLFDRLADPAVLPTACRELARLAYAAPDLGVFLSVIAAAGLALPILGEHGPDPESEIGRLRARARAGLAVIGVAVTELEAGSDVMAMQTKLSRGSDGTLRLEGSKWHITNAPVADALIVFAIDATTDDRFLTAVVVEPRDAGVRCGPALDLVGCRGSPTGVVHLEDVRIPPDRVIGRREDGRRLLELAFLRERVLAPWPLLGKMGRVLEECLDHVEKRVQFGRPLSDFQLVDDKILSALDAMMHARHLAERAVESVSRGRADVAMASLAKAAAADAAVVTFRNAIEVHGSYGVQTDRRYGEYLADALCAQIAGGTRETHKKIVFGELRLERARARHGRPSPLLLGDMEEVDDAR